VTETPDEARRYQAAEQRRQLRLQERESEKRKRDSLDKPVAR
jgi:hypothetical protein